jgi:hypothetical protein
MYTFFQRVLLNPKYQVPMVQRSVLSNVAITTPIVMSKSWWYLLPLILDQVCINKYCVHVAQYAYCTVM